MAALETLVFIAFIGFLLAAVFALKTHLIVSEATNMWMLFSMGFAALALWQLTVLLSSSDSLAFLGMLKDPISLTGIALIFSAMAVYYKEKRVCRRVYKKRMDGKLSEQIETFADGL